MYPKAVAVAPKTPTGIRHKVPPAVAGFATTTATESSQITPTPFAKAKGHSSFLSPVDVDVNVDVNDYNFQQDGMFDHVAEGMLERMQVRSLRESGAVARTIMNVETGTDEIVEDSLSAQVKKNARNRYKKLTELKSDGPEQNTVLDFIEHSMTISGDEVLNSQQMNEGFDNIFLSQG